MMTYQAITKGIEVSVRTTYLTERSDPAQGLYFWAYHITLYNHTDHPVQLLNRHWVMIDAHGQRREITGVGVVGEQPVIAPSSSFSYTSGCPLPTPSGFMSGRYDMLGASGERFWIEVPSFSLDLPLDPRILN